MKHELSVWRALAGWYGRRGDYATQRHLAAECWGYHSTSQCFPKRWGIMLLGGAGWVTSPLPSGSEVSLEEEMHSKIAVALLVLGLPVAALAQTGKGSPPVRTNFGTCTEQQVI